MIYPEPRRPHARTAPVRLLPFFPLPRHEPSQSRAEASKRHAIASHRIASYLHPTCIYSRATMATPPPRKRVSQACRPCGVKKIKVRPAQPSPAHRVCCSTHKQTNLKLSASATGYTLHVLLVRAKPSSARMGHRNEGALLVPVPGWEMDANDGRLPHTSPDMADTSFADHDPSMPRVLVREPPSIKHLATISPSSTLSTISALPPASRLAYRDEKRGVASETFRRMFRRGCF